MKTKEELFEEKLAKIILETNNRDYCRACEPCDNPPCQKIRDLAKKIRSEL